MFKVREIHCWTIALIIFIATQGVLVSQLLFPSLGGVSDDSTVLAQIYWGLVSVVQLSAGTTFFLRYARSRRGNAIEANTLRWLSAIFILILLICLASASWSVNRDVTLRRTYSLAANLLFGASVLVTLGSTQTLRLISLACLVPVSISLFFYLTGFEWARMENAYIGAARGLYAQKNVFGMYSWIALLGAISIFRTRSTSRAKALIGIACALLSLVAAQSMTASGAALLSILVYGLVVSVSKMSSPLRAISACVALLVTVSLGALVVTEGSILTALIGRDITLTGRTEIWSYVYQAIERRPIAGYGYAAFWRTNEFTMFYISRLFGYDVSHSHNGLLDVALDLGMIGVIPLICVIVAAAVAIFRRLLLSRLDENDAFWMALFAGLVLTSLAEPIYLVHNSFCTIIFWYALLFSLRKEKRLQSLAVSPKLVATPPN